MISVLGNPRTSSERPCDSYRLVNNLEMAQWLHSAGHVQEVVCVRATISISLTGMLVRMRTRRTRRVTPDRSDCGLDRKKAPAWTFRMRKLQH